jgi:secreted trypsin-like serine protease
MAGPMRLRAAIASVLALVALAAAAPAGAVVGGAALPDNARTPYQVAVHAGTSFCGGTLTGPQTVVTAAHCVITDDGRHAKAPQDVVVRVGSHQRSLLSSHAVDRVALLPDYDGVFRLDAAVLHLAQPLVTVPGSVEPIAALASSAPPAGAELFVSGWGFTGTSSALQPTLHGAGLTQRSDATCKSRYGAHFDGSVMLCAGDTLLDRPIGGERDSCNGDSGGPLTNGSATAKGTVLHGIVSYGPQDCGSFYGVYTEVAAPAVRLWLTSDPPDAPRPAGPVAVAGVPVTGSVLTCDPGTWTGQPQDFTFQFLAQDGAGWLPLTEPGPTRTFVPAPGDAGRVIVCTAKARNAGGFGSGTSTPVKIVAAPGAAETTPPATPTPPPAPPTAVEQPTPAADVTPPVARVTKARCTARGCTLRVQAVDPPPSAGVRGLAVRVRSTVPGRPPVTKTLVARPLAGGTFSVVARGVPRGRHRFTIVAVDQGGNRQPVATTKVLTRR